MCFSIEAPCKVELTSNGPFKTQYAELMGVYSLVDNNLCHGRPVWTKQNHFLIMDDGLCQLCFCQKLYTYSFSSFFRWFLGAV